jgi:site-specific recombinase XerD
MKLKVAYLKWRDGRPRWEPGPRLREKGWRGRDLKDDAGNWLDLARAIEAAESLNADVAAWRATGGKRRSAPPPRKTARSCEHLWDEWRKSPKFARLKTVTARDYRNKARLFLDEFAEAPVAAVDRSHLYVWWERQYHARGHTMANGILAVVRSMFSHAQRIGWRADNPARELGLPGVAPRLVLWLPEEISAMVAAADRLGMPSVGDGVIVGLHTGQRLGDVLRLPDRLFGEDRIKLSQAKRGARIDAPMTPALAERIAAIRARRQASSVVTIDAPLILQENGQPYDPNNFGKAFRKVRAEAATAFPEILDKRYLDLRDTAVTRQALAGCDLWEIASITGHAMNTITTIIRHYLVLQPEMADSAIAKLSRWLKDQEIAL